MTQVEQMRKRIKVYVQKCPECGKRTETERQRLQQCECGNDVLIEYLLEVYMERLVAAEQAQCESA